MRTIKKSVLTCNFLLLLSLLFAGCDPMRTIVIKNKHKEPIYVLLKYQKGRNILNNFGQDTLIPFGTTKVSNYWEQYYSVGKWDKSEMNKITNEITNSLYFEVFDIENQRFQNPDIRIKTGLFNKNKVVIEVKK